MNGHVVMNETFCTQGCPLLFLELYVSPLLCSVQELYVNPLLRSLHQHILCFERKETVTEHSRKPTPPATALLLGHHGVLLRPTVWLSDESMYRPGMHRNQEMRKDIQTNIYASESRKEKQTYTNKQFGAVGRENKACLRR